MRTVDADKYCEFLNTYPLEKAQSNFMAFYKDALQHTFECEVEAIPVEWIEKYCADIIFSDDYAANTEWYDDTLYAIEGMVRDWRKENEDN